MFAARGEQGAHRRFIAVLDRLDERNLHRRRGAAAAVTAITAVAETRATAPNQLPATVTRIVMSLVLTLAAGPHPRRELTFLHWRWGPTPSAN